MVQRTVARVLNAAGIAAPVLWVAAVVYIGSLRPEYSHSRQYISELAARGTPTQHLMQVAGFLLPGLMVVAFGLLVGLSAHTKLAGAGAALLIVGGIARIAAGVFPLDPCCAPIAPSFSERMHNAAGATYVLATSAAVLIWCSVSERTFRTRAHWFRAVLAGHVRGGDHAAVVADSLWDRSSECRAVSACVIRHPESLALRVRAGRLVAVELAR